ncbi:hypothetical protein [Pseudescherichia vulneris]|uniref:hypothetical protein n=1 Tax=Pseudescherichia vulneris TaxID=566 RepID=UPI001EDF9C1C|nr:hypothetical protein [Pseudescherichia vulneris]
MMNTNSNLSQVLILGAALMASTLFSSVYAADATLSFTGEITPAANSTKVTAKGAEGTLLTNQKNSTEPSTKQGENHATR